jgi:uncharacterized membrane protein YfcA
MEGLGWIALPLIGFAGGFGSGFLGLGGGVIMFPLLTFVGGVPTKLATGTDLVHVVIAAATSMLSHHRAGMVDVKAGLIMGVAGIIGGLGGSFLSVPLSNHALQGIYLAVVILATAVLFIPLPSEEKNFQMGRINQMAGIAAGMGVGCLTGMLGVGGGFIIVPFMTYALRVPLRISIGTSLLIILITSLGTFPAKFGVGHIDITITGLVLSGSVTGALLGSFFSRRTPVKSLRAALIGVLILIILLVGYKLFLR